MAEGIATRSSRGHRTICLPIEEEDYLRIIHDPKAFRRTLDDCFRQTPEVVDGSAIGYVALLTTVFVAFFGMTFLEAVAVTKVLNPFLSLVATAVFAVRELIDWKLGLILGATGTDFLTPSTLSLLA